MSYLLLTCECGHQNIRSMQSYASHPYCLQEVIVNRGANARRYICRHAIDEATPVKLPEVPQ